MFVVMIIKYSQIKESYDRFYTELLASGKLPLRDTGIGFWENSVSDDIWHLFNKIDLKRYKNFLDLGSGDGKVVLIASLFTNAHGIEADPELHKKAEEMKKRHNVRRAKFFHGNYMDHDLSKYDIIFLNPDKRLTELEPKLKSELKGKLIVYNHLFHPQTLKKDMHFMAGTTPMTIYVNK